MNLFSVIAQSKILDDPGILLDSDRCLRARNRKSDCEICVRSCPVGALQLDPTVVLDQTKCMSCGLCLHICPTDAFSGDDDRSDLLDCVRKIGTGDVIELACALHPAPQIGPVDTNAVICTKSCLAALGASTYVRLLISGTTRVILRLDACAECAMGQALPHIERTLATVRHLLSGADDASKVVALKIRHGQDTQIRPVYRSKNPPVSRREMFSLFSRESKRWATQASRIDASLSKDAKGPPRERRRLITALRQSAPWQIASMQLSTQDLNVSRLAANDECTACGTCARICPTGALEFTNPTSNSYRLTFLTGACTDCGACLDVCKSRALQRHGIPTLGELLDQEPLVLQAGLLRGCQKCDAKFATTRDVNLCPICDLRKQNPFVNRRSTELQR